MTSASRTRLVARASLASLVALALAGATYQGVATALERNAFTRPGGLVSVGDYQLHIYCTGQGSPVVVLEAAAGAISPAWGLVQPVVSRSTRVCSYDRAGLGWSEGDGRFLPDRVADDLRTLLDQAKEEGPFVVVGHELGAVFARDFAARYPADTAAVVLVDDPRPDRLPVLPPGVPLWPWLARLGLLRISERVSETATALPGRAGGAMRAFLNRPDHLTQAAREVTRRAEIVQGSSRTAGPVRARQVTSRVHGTPAIFATRADAAPVSRAVLEVVAEVRAETAPTAESAPPAAP